MRPKPCVLASLSALAQGFWKSPRPQQPSPCQVADIPRARTRVHTHQHLLWASVGHSPQPSREVEAADRVVWIPPRCPCGQRRATMSVTVTAITNAQSRGLEATEAQNLPFSQCVCVGGGLLLCVLCSSCPNTSLSPLCCFFSLVRALGHLRSVLSKGSIGGPSLMCPLEGYDFTSIPAETSLGRGRFG